MSVPFGSGTFFGSPPWSDCRFKFQFLCSYLLPAAITKRRAALHTLVKHFKISALICPVNQFLPSIRKFHRPIAQLKQRFRPFTNCKTRPLPGSGIFYKTGTKRICLDISQNSKVMTVILNGEALEASLIQMADPQRSMRSMIPLCMCQSQPSHEL